MYVVLTDCLLCEHDNVVCGNVMKDDVMMFCEPMTCVVTSTLYAWRTLANFCCKSGDLPTYAQKLSMYAGRLAKTFVFCCPDQLNKRRADSKIESVSQTFVANVCALKNFCCQCTRELNVCCRN